MKSTKLALILSVLLAQPMSALAGGEFFGYCWVNGPGSDYKTRHTTRLFLVNEDAFQSLRTLKPGAHNMAGYKSEDVQGQFIEAVKKHELKFDPRSANCIAATTAEDVEKFYDGTKKPGITYKKSTFGEWMPKGGLVKKAGLFRD